MIFREPMTSLNPVMRVGEQIEEAIRAHETKMSKTTAHARVITAMRQAARSANQNAARSNIRINFPEDCASAP
jgi:ABC-type microcin C transport system duplicated ATPase subunit YejF